MKTKFVKIDSILIADLLEKPYSFTEWFCLDSTWKHLYNIGNTRSNEFQKWCAEREFANSVCPDVTIDGAVLNDGWGSDICARHCGLVDGEEYETEWADRMDAALTGIKQEFSVKGPRGELKVVMTPFETIAPDEESIKAFGPFEKDIRSSIVVANIIGSAEKMPMTKQQLKDRIRDILNSDETCEEQLQHIEDVIDSDEECEANLW